MTALPVLIIIVLYFSVLILISRVTATGDDNNSFFLAGRNAPWLLVAFGMVGATLSGITFISIPGKVGDPTDQFSYFQMCMGFFTGYMFIAFVLLPIYYRLNLVSIYGYLNNRFGLAAYKTGAAYFLLSRSIGSAIRLLLVAQVLHEVAFGDWGVPFEVTVIMSILLIWVYTYKGGIKTIIFTDTLQTVFMLASLGVTIYLLHSYVITPNGGLIDTVMDSGFSQIFFFNDFLANKHHFLKEFVGGFFICIGMTGMDQDMMQKNLTCKSLREAQKNMVVFSVIVMLVIFTFLFLGALLYQFAINTGFDMPLNADGDIRRDMLFPLIATKSELSGILGIVFILGLIAAAYSSADSAMTAMTTSVCVDFLNIDQKPKPKAERLRKNVHISVSVALFFIILILHYTLNLSAIEKVIFFAGFTYGPLIGLFLFGIFTKKHVRGRAVVPIALAAPIATFIALQLIPGWTGYKFGGELIALNAGLTYVGLWIASIMTQKENPLQPQG